MSILLTAFVAITLSLFVTELTDKDALLILALATRMPALRVFLAGAIAFVITTSIIVTVGAIAITLLPIIWIRTAGGLVMVAYGIWELKGVVGLKTVESEERKLFNTKGSFRDFLLIVGTLALLDLAGDATEALTIVFVAQYSDAILVFLATCTGLIAATAFETALGNKLGRILTPARMRYVSIVVFLTIGASILLLTIL